MGSKYLTFLDLALQDNEFSNVDYVTRAVGLPSMEVFTIILSI